MKSLKVVRPVFRNVDLEIESDTKLNALAAALSKKLVVLYAGPAKKGHLLNLECFRSHRSPEATIHDLCSVVERLSAEGKRLWATARRKEFDIGFNDRPTGARFTLRNDTIRRVAGLNATLAVTFYAEDFFAVDKAGKGVISSGGKS
jgi:hypothetical protein